MRKLLSVIALCAVLPVFDVAAYDGPGGRCYAAFTDKPYNFKVYFENDMPKKGNTDFRTLGADEQCVNDLVASLNGIDDAKWIILLGAADKKGSLRHNIPLAQRRVDTVYNLLDSERQKRVWKRSGSNAFDIVENGAVGAANPEERAVYVIIVENEPTQEQVQNIINNITINSTHYVSNTTFNLQLSNPVEQNKREIEKLASDIEAESRKAGTSVWKDKDGNFNTMRLTSDSVAGVVLGTAGGLITSHVIKKNQLKSGFSGIKCTIGGQIVAEYGDDFNVGKN